MDRVSKEELFTAIVSNDILIPYLGGEAELAALLENPHHCNIHYPRNHASVNQIMPALQGICVLTGAHIPDELVGDAQQ
jgi:hypothetical protein